MQAENHDRDHDGDDAIGECLEAARAHLRLGRSELFIRRIVTSALETRSTVMTTRKFFAPFRVTFPHARASVRPAARSYRHDARDREAVPTAQQS
jgi:hypothetical protein